MTVDRLQKRYIIASAIIQGIKIAHVAAALGVSRSWASREANLPGVRNIIDEFVAANREKIEQLFNEALAVISEAMRGRCTSAVVSSFRADLTIR